MYRTLVTYLTIVRRSYGCIFTLISLREDFHFLNGTCFQRNPAVVDEPIFNYIYIYINFLQGKVIDKELLNAIKPTKLRNKVTTSRPRPKTIHVDAGAELDSGVLTPSRGKKGSSSNLSTGKSQNFTFQSYKAVLFIRD